MPRHLITDPTDAFPAHQPTADDRAEMDEWHRQRDEMDEAAELEFAFDEANRELSAFESKEPIIYPF